MNNSLVSSPGCPQPLGSIRIPGGVNFAVFSRHAESVTLILQLPVDKGKQLVFPLDPARHKTGDIWHIQLPDLPPGTTYGYRMDGPCDPAGSGHRYDTDLILIDPYAHSLVPTGWGEDRSCLGTRPCCLIPEEAYDWEDDRPLGRPLQDSIIYELHVRGFTRDPSSGVKYPGTFAGIIEKIPYLKELGITAVELMPVVEFNENESIFTNPFTGEELKNFWGYSPLSFFAPKAAYSSACLSNTAENHLFEFKTMVKELHRAGIEVIIDIVFNHTGEGGADGPTSSFRGIDNTIYYLLDPYTRDYLNFSGCGNTCNCNHPIVRTLIMDVLRWWVVEMHVDGFRFDLASILGRDQSGNILSNPPVVEQIAEDPILADSKIIAEAWDAAGLYQVGSFSTHQRWAEWNGRFRDDVRSFVCGAEGKIAALATRIAGSSDLYQHNDRQPCNSINFITSHDGFTLSDLVSYNEKHNLANGENNRDGDNYNISWNSGAEGDTKDQAINELRRRRIKTMAALLLISQGVPMITAGDEFGRSQKGNNNAYCQDNEISWINWHLVDENHDLARFFRKLIRLRRDHPVFRRDDFFNTKDRFIDPFHLHEIIWQGLRPGEQDWSHGCKTLGFTLNGSEVAGGSDDDFFIMLNGDRREKAKFTIPSIPTPHGRHTWRKIVDTAGKVPDDIVDFKQGLIVSPTEELTVLPMGCIILQHTNHAKREAKSGE